MKMNFFLDLMFSMFEFNTMKMIFNFLFSIFLVKLIYKNLFINLSGYNFFLKIMSFIFLFNILSMLPYGYNLTSLSTNLILSFTIWFSMMFFFLIKYTNKNVGHFLPQGSPTMMMFPLVIIETISVLMRPLSLGVRLMSNITSGHLVMHLMSEVTILGLIFLTLFEFFVCFIQSYIFFLLSNIYLQELN
uniref:ATP synthase subunit a n=1 Tax=Didemnum vexillum TaxID=516032 RepID=A0A0A7LK34_9ASCI|nr:ATP synthase F0 subunit 6 [Didemnum vexillum]AIZ58123.2 ATP synthase subunit 6 [Didemnum vexillum]UYK51627.1 ATP synthase F0 subunit 6 [Didemnum vexillum]